MPERKGEGPQASILEYSKQYLQIFEFLQLSSNFRHAIVT